ncbi:MAG: phosphotransferase, partial [bacterium]|nr:phosphotransferase [bacterium]
EGARRYDEAWVDGAWGRLQIDRVLHDVPDQESLLVQAGLGEAKRALASAWEAGPGGPVVLVHADVHAANVLEVARHDDRVELALIDLDRVGLAPVALDLTFALLEHADATAWACLRGYRQVRPLAADFERVYAAFRLLATVDTLAFLAGFDREHGYVAAAWPGLVAACAALTAPSALVVGRSSAPER